MKVIGKTTGVNLYVLGLGNGFLRHLKQKQPKKKKKKISDFIEVKNFCQRTPSRK